MDKKQLKTLLSLKKKKKSTFSAADWINNNMFKSEIQKLGILGFF